MPKPDHLFDRDAEWAALQRFVDAPSPGSTLGLVYGRRRQGKTYLLETLTERPDALYFQALRQSSPQNLHRLSLAYQQHTGQRAPVAFADWSQAFTALLALGENAAQPFVVVIDEFPYLLETAPAIPSILQNLLTPRGPAVRGWRTRLILCGSALSTMISLLTGTAPLRGRASLELTVHPFGYRDAATFWQVAHDPDTAVRLHSLVGGTPAYLDMSGGVSPRGPLDEWVVDTLLNPASAMFREGAVLVSEDDRIGDATPYLSILSAISAGATRPGQIAAAIGRQPTAMRGLLSVLEQARLIAPVQDALKQKRPSYAITEPLLRLNQLVIAPYEAALSRHRGKQVWAQVAETVSSHIYGPHFEDLARAWTAEFADPDIVGGPVDTVGPSVVNCREHARTHQLDVVALTRTPHGPTRIAAIGEAKWRSTPPGTDQVRRLEHIRTLLPDADRARLLLFSRASFDRTLSAAARSRADLELIDLRRLYA